MKILHKLLLIGASVLMGFGHTIQAKENKPYQHLENPLVVKSELRTGQLKNGLIYYIKPIEDSKDIQVSLYIKVGSFHQEPDQYEIAHFMEHIALKAGKHISLTKRYDSDLFSEAGIEPNDVVARTSKAYTWYSFDLPAHKKAIETAFLLYSDILWGLEFKQVYIDSERSPIIGEHEIGGGNAGIASMSTYLENKITGCSGTPPINYTDYIGQLKRGPLLRFYRQWYRPEHAALVIVGNVKNIEELEQEIKTKFSRTNDSKKSTHQKDCIESYHASEPKFVKQKRKTLLKSKKDESYWQLYMRNNREKETNKINALKEQWLRKLMVNLLNDRLKQITQEYNTYYFANITYLNLIRAFQINIGVTQEGGDKKAIQETMGVLKEIRQNGISSLELVQLKQNIIGTLGNKNNKSISYWKQEIRNKVAYGEVLLENKIALHLKFLENLSLTRFNRALQFYIKEMPEDIGIIASEDHPIFSIKENVIRQWIRQAELAAPSSTKENEIEDGLLSKEEMKLLTLSSYKKLDSSIPNASEYLLENGVKLVVKPYQPASSVFGDEDKIRIHGFSNKGAKCYPKEDYYSALNANQIVLNSGIAGKNKFALAQYLKAKDYNGTIYPYIRPYESGVKLNTSIEKLEIALQLIYLYFTEPNYDEKAYKDWKVNASYKYLSDINEDDFTSKIKQTLGDPYFIPSGTKALVGIEQTDLKRAYQIYKQLFGNADDFTFLFSGNFKEKEVLQLCRKYLGNLPTSHHKISCLKQPVIPKNRPSISRYHQFQAKGNLNNIRVVLIYLSPLDEDNQGWKDKIKLNVVYNLLNSILMKELRFKSKKGGPYTVAAGNYHFDNEPRYKEIAIFFGGRPQDIERLIKEAKQVIENMKNANVSEKMFQTSLKTLYPEKDKFTNLELQKNMYDRVKYGKSWVSITQKRKYINSLSLKEVVNFAMDILRNPPYEFKLLPNEYE